MIFKPVRKIDKTETSEKPQTYLKNQKNDPITMESIKKIHQIVRSKMNEQLLSRKEAAEFLGVRESTLAYWKSTNQEIIPTYKIGKFIKYKASDLQNFLNNREVKDSV